MGSVEPAWSWKIPRVSVLPFRGGVYEDRERLVGDAAKRQAGDESA